MAPAEKAGTGQKVPPAPQRRFGRKPARSLGSDSPESAVPGTQGPSPSFLCEMGRTQPPDRTAGDSGGSPIRHEDAVGGILKRRELLLQGRGPRGSSAHRLGWPGAAWCHVISLGEVSSFHQHSGAS